MKELKELVELAKKATPGEWKADWYDDERGYVTWYIDLERQRTAFFLADGGPELNGTGSPSEFDKADCNFIAAANPQTIIKISEAFQELEERAEAAESKLAELESQEPAGWQYRFNDGMVSLPWKTVDSEGECNPASLYEKRKIFTRPAPAINLAELAGLDKLAGDMLNLSLNSTRKQALAYAKCADMLAKHAAILRNIEELPK